MLEVENETALPHAILPFTWPDDTQRQTLIVKATYRIENSQCLIDDEQLPILFSDELDKAKQSIKFAADTAPFKPKTDVALVGCVVSPNEKLVKQMHVRVCVADREKKLLVTGDRQWKIPLLLVGWNQSTPQAFSRMELSYARAFGGMDDTSPGFCAENPVGIGYLAKKSKKEIADSPIPNIEYENDALDSPTDKVKPAGFGFIHSAWKPRSQFLGTYDEQWEKTRKPLLAKDFSMSYFNAAPDDQQFHPYLKGGESVELDGFRAEGILRFKLPIAPFNIEATDRQSQRTHVLMCLDTVCLLTEEMRLYLVWRAVIEQERVSTIEKLTIKSL